MKKSEAGKGFVFGVLLTTMAVSMVVPALATSIEAAFNSVNITVNQEKVAGIGQSLKLDNGTEVPFSIVYNGTTYLPLRKLGELTGKDIQWDGTTSTVSIKDGAPLVEPETHPTPTPDFNKIKQQLIQKGLQKIEIKDAIRNEESTIAQLHRQLDSNTRSLAVAEKDMEKAKSQGTRMYVQGQGFVYVADQEAIDSAQRSIDSYSGLVNQCNDLLSSSESNIANYTQQLEQIEAEISKLNASLAA